MVAKGDGDGETDPEVASPPEASAIDGEPSKPSLIRQATNRVADVVFLVWTVFIQTAGAAFGVGLLLNLCGFGYRFSLFPPSLEVNTLEAVRQEKRDRSFVNEARQELFPSDAADVGR
jgi:hypothetical protein